MTTPSDDSSALTPTWPVNLESHADDSGDLSAPTREQSPIIPADDSPNSLRERIPALKARVDRDYVQLARDLWTVHSLGHYKTWGFPTFNDYVVQVGISIGSANRLRRLWSRLIISVGLRPSQLNGIGYSSAKLLSSVIDRTNATDWIEKGKTLTYRDLQAEVDKMRPPALTIPPPSSTSSPASSSVISSPFMKRRSFYLSAEQEEALDEALAESSRISNSYSENFNLYLICIKFLADCMTQEQAPDARLRFFMRHLERIHGGRVLHVRTPEAFEVLQKAIDAHPELFTRSDE